MRLLNGAPIKGGSSCTRNIYGFIGSYTAFGSGTILGNFSVIWWNSKVISNEADEKERNN